MKLSELGDLNWIKCRFRKDDEPVYCAEEGSEPWCGKWSFKTLQECVDFINEDCDDEDKVSVNEVEDDLEVIEYWKAWIDEEEN